MDIGLNFCVLKIGKETWTGGDFKKPILIFLILASLQVSAQSLLPKGGAGLSQNNLVIVQPPDSTVQVERQMALFQVWICLSEVCMISRYYAKELNLWHTNLKKQGIFLAGFFPNAFSTDSSIREFKAANQIGFPLFKDSMGIFGRSANIRLTPEVLVLDRNGHIQYQGRIDDFYVAIGRHKTRVSQAYLKNALRNLLAGKPPEKKWIEPVGCLIDYSLWSK
jgi:hypothetical protein